jgi:hypothetical protein
MPWTPLFTDAAAEPFTRAVSTIVDGVSAVEVAATDWGPALLHTYLPAAGGEPLDTSRADSHINRAMDQMENGELPFTLYGGLCGVAWLCAHTDAVFDRRSEDAYEDVDQLLVTLSEAPLRKGYDLISGAVGLGVYFLERLPSNVATDGLAHLVDALQASAIVTDDQATWFTPSMALPAWQREIAPEGYYNLGVAHGVPGIIGLLAEMKRAGVLPVGAERLLRQACRWVVRQRQPDGLYSPWIAPGVTPVTGRVSWCYGELGLSLTLLSAAIALQDEDLRQSAIDIARASAARTDFEKTLDAALCHGAAGNGHLFNRLFQATGLQEFRTVATFWYTRALEMRLAGAGIGGYRAWRPLDMHFQPRENPWEDDPGFLTGASGIALAFLAAVTHVEPTWDRVLLSRLDPI